MITVKTGWKASVFPAVWRDSLAEKEKKSGFGRIKLIIIVCVLVYVGITYANQQSILASQTARNLELRQQEEELEREIEFKKNELAYIGSTDYVEQQARERLGWLKPDEIKYVEGQGAAAEDTGEAQDGSGGAGETQGAPDEAE
jgi:cell division protein FtsB